MKKIIGFAALALLLLAPAAHADTVPGWYLSPGVIAHFPIDSTAKVGGVSNSIAYDMGWGIEGSLGYAWPDGIRLEEEASMMRANVDKVGGATSQHSGRLANFLLMTNVLYDFQTGTRWTPYIGVGAGLDAISADHIGAVTGGGSLNDSDAELGYQAIAGTSYQLADHWSISADYRYIASTDANLKITTGGTTHMDNSSHNLVISMRYTMHAPAPPPPPIQEVAAPAPLPAPAPARAPVVAPVPQSYMVFFDFDKSVLTPEAQRIIAAAAEDFKKNGYARLIVTGHTDTMGSDSYNQRLSERRAAAVRAELTRLGVDPGMIGTSGRGEKQLLVPTPNQVREAQNRRAEIVLSKGQ